MEKEEESKEETNLPNGNPNVSSITSPGGFSITLSTDELSIQDTILRTLDLYEFLIEKTKEGKKENKTDYIR